MSKSSRDNVVVGGFEVIDKCDDVKPGTSDLKGSEKPGTLERSSHVCHEGIVLVPTPTDDHRDPLNWSPSRKYAILAVLSLATFAGFASAIAPQLTVAPFAALYGVDKSTMAYQNSASSAGMATGGLLFWPLSHIIGRPSAIFWSVLGCMLAQMWSALMTRSDDYTAYLVSRGAAGFFGTIVAILGPRLLIDLFFLHQRGRAFTFFHFWFDFGTLAGPTIFAFITAASDWQWGFWWTVLMNGISAVLILCFVPNTDWDRRRGMHIHRRPTDRSWIGERAATFLPGTQIMPRTSFREVAKVSIIPFKIVVTPVAIMMSLFSLLNFGFYVGMNSVTPVWLQTPVDKGGYGFTTRENALFSFFHWGGVLLALIYGQLLSDRLPLAIARRYAGGKWKPEYRLHVLWLPALVCNPISLGVFGYALQHQLSWGILGFCHVLLTFGSLSITPVTVNYISECFVENIAEATIVLNAFRVAFGLSIAFYVNGWVASVGFGWCYATMGFIQVFSSVFLIALMLKGHEIRQWDPFGLVSTEEGEHVLGKGQRDE